MHGLHVYLKRAGGAVGSTKPQEGQLSHSMSLLGDVGAAFRRRIVRSGGSQSYAEDSVEAGISRPPRWQVTCNVGVPHGNLGRCTGFQEAVEVTRSLKHPTKST